MRGMTRAVVQVIPAIDKSTIIYMVCTVIFIISNLFSNAIQNSLRVGYRSREMIDVVEFLSGHEIDPSDESSNVKKI